MAQASPIKFASDPAIKPLTYEFGNSLKIKIMPSNIKFSTFFVVGGQIDRQASGWIVPDIVENIQICVAEKSKKILPYKKNYPEWWLILVDHISGGFLEHNDISSIQHFLNEKEIFNKVIIVDRENFSRSFEL